MDRKPPPPFSIAELVVEAMRYRSKRGDLDWIMCYHIAAWEERAREEASSDGRPVVHGHFAWYHRQAICVRALARAELEIDRARRAIERGTDPQELWDYGMYFCNQMLHPECRREWLLLEQELSDHGLPMYQNRS